MGTTLYRYPLVMALGTACAAPADEAPPMRLTEVEFASPGGSGEPNLAVAGDTVLLNWFESDGDDHALRFARHDGSGWSPAVTVASERPFFVNWADFPSMAQDADGTLYIHWLERVAASPYAYHAVLARSDDGGATWSEPVTIHEDRSPAEHGFVSMVPAPDGGVDLVWLDGRNTGELGGAMQVRSGSFGGEHAVERELDGRACDCCQTAMVRSSHGLVAAYRDRSDDEIRDIAVSRLTPTGWTEPYHVGNDHWRIPGCPVNGPALAAWNDAVAVAWFSAPEAGPRVQVAFSTDGGASFAAPIRVDPGQALGRVDVELLAPDVALVSWLERQGEEGRVWVRRVEASGALDEPFLITDTNPNRRSGFPRMARVGDDVVLAWTVVGDDGGVRVARLKLGDRPKPS